MPKTSRRLSVVYSGPTGSRLVAPGMMGYKVQVVASAIALPIRWKIEKGGWSTVDFRGLKPPHIVVNQGGSWVGFVEGNESFKMVVVASKNSTGVGRNRSWKMGDRIELFWLIFLFFYFLSYWLMQMGLVKSDWVPFERKQFDW